MPGVWLARQRAIFTLQVRWKTDFYLSEGAGMCVEQLHYFHGVGGGISHTGSTSMLLKSAGETISRYSMSGE